MSKTRKCDRCGKIYGLRAKNIRNKYRDSVRIKVHDIDCDGTSWASYSYDLCHDCSDDLGNFLNFIGEEETNE